MVIPIETLSRGWVGKPKMKRGSSGLHKFWLLLWKNWILQRRRKIQTLVEVLLPVVFCVLLVVIRDLAPYGIFLQPTYYKPFEVSQLPANLTPNDNGGFFSEWAQQIFSDDSSERRRRSLSASESQGLPHLSDLHNSPFSTHYQYKKYLDKQKKSKHRRKRFLDFFNIFDPMWPIAYSPNNTVITKLMELVSTRLNIDERGLGFANEEDLVDRLTTFTKEEENEEVEDILGGIVFTNEFPKDDVLPENIQYKIRLKGSLRSFTKRNPFLPPPQWYTELSYPLYQVPGPRDRTNNHGGRPGYYTEGFLALQHAVDMAIAEYFTGTNPDVHYVVEMQRMPYPPFIDDKYLVALQAWLPFVLLLSYIYPAINIVKSVVYEKEKKLKESMKMMGLQNWLHWLAWFTKTFMFLATSTVFITILLCTHWHGPGSLAVLSESDPTLVFVFLLLYTTCSVCFCFFLSTLFSKANSAAAVTGLIWFFTYVPYMILRPRYSSLTMTSKIMLCLLSNTAMSLGCQLTSMFEGVGSGIQWDLLFTGVSPDDSFTLGHVFGMFILDIIIFLLLTWYIEAVWPGEFGVPKPWYFPFMSSYWLGRNSEDWHQSIINPCVADASLFEEDPQGIPAGVQVEGLTKVFPRGRNVAVNNMFLNMYDGQITVLLGHNGAGKTTTMSMLTGLYPPTSGTARVGGYDIVSQMVEVRHSLGLCPQHDVLFDELTVAEHIKFFSKLKGLSNAKAEAEVSSILEKLKLQDKIDATAKTLSGGMKRKLSVGIALCGGSRVVFLDEPTSGMDPGARRLIWDLLQEERSGRTILLTTHFMEEADLLGDRIAIMANGVVQCCGSSLFLKRKYEAGYRLIIVKAKGCDVHAITDVLQSHIPDAELDQNVGAELSYVLPNADVAKFEALFLQLETQKEDLMISSYGASQTTMDEVFFRVGEATDPDIIGHLHKVIPSSLKNRANSALDGVGKENGLLLDIEQGDSLEEVQTDDTPQVQGRAAATWFNAAIQRVTFVLENAKDVASNHIKPSVPSRVPLQRNTGCILLLQQFRAMLVKKILYTFRNLFLTLAQNVIPVAFLILALVVVQTLPGINDAPPEVHFTLNTDVCAPHATAKDVASNHIKPSVPSRVPLQRNTGCILLLQQFRAMLVKKILYTFRNLFLTLAQNVIPVAFLILALVVVQTLPGINDAPPEVHFTLNKFDGTVTALQLLQTNNYTDHLEEAVKLHFIHRNKLKMVEPDFNFSTFILDQTQSDIPSFNQHWMVALQIEGVKYGAHILAMFNNQPFHTPPLALTIADTAVIRAVTGNKNITIATSNHPLPRTDIEKLTQDQRQNLGFQIGFNLAFGMSFLAASFVIFVIQERSTKAKHLQFVSGVNFITYWTASAIWDYILFMVPCCFCLLCLFLFGLKGLSEGEQLARIMLVFVHYAWVTLPLMYLCSFLFTVPSAGFTRMIIINIISGMATVITVTILRIPDLELGHVADMLDWIFLLFPSYAMAAAITDVYSNYRSTEICKRSTVSLICTLGIAPNPCCREADNCGSFGCVDWNEDFLSWEKLGIGRMLVFMGVEGILFYILIALTELKVFQTIRYSLSRIWHKVAIKPWRDVELEGDSMNPEDEDVKAERLRIRDTPLDQLQETEKLIFRDLCKTYNGDFVAVDHLNLGVPLGECFGLLGINGAGKTTTFKMLTGDLPVSSGDAFVNGYSIKSDMKNVQQQIGYCPQFDALHDHMTGREALRMFARLRGVPERQINGMIAVLADQLLVTQHLDNLFGNYSGGNKRKLSTGVALVGDPPLVLLDEPSSGMDPVARRLLWDVLTSVRDAGRSIILTSHSMEECEALCTRLAIMVNGKFCCLGSPQHLKSKFSEGYSVIIRVHMSNSQESNDPSLTELPAEMLTIKQFVEKTFPANHLREIQWGRLEYFIPAEGLTWASVFGTIERNRQELPIDDYSVTQTTLERVFLTFTRGQRPEGIDSISTLALS
ncbi:phospholipid-transporting ATPase ABCA3-like [Homarus americanus]|uniref:phospholipid-transporting ATPase ABCA3-like n=1 Tax=Homarus americanus TaxID=6706 RepID=UPI001C452848|nr:phospholipid-transporting ATPase ABCA3-like [Homarus americanus]